LRSIPPRPRRAARSSRVVAAQTGGDAWPARDVSIEAQREGLAYDDIGPAEKTVKKSLQKQLQSDLERQAKHEQGKLQSEATKRLEGELADLQKELNQAINRVTAEALKRKAAQLGAIKEMSEDPQTGSLTIKVEV
jgi:hypothetical protein